MKTQFTKLCVLALTLLAVSCNKNKTDKLPEEQVNNQEAKLAGEVQVPEVLNGMLKFTNFRSFRYFNPQNNVEFKTIVAGAARGSEPFISMKQAFDSIVKADAIIGEQLRTSHPNGPASLYNNTHTALAGTFANANYVAGDAVNGYYYDINSFDFGATNKINKDGFVQVENWLLQYSKDSLKMWLVGSNNAAGRFGSNVTFAANMKDKSSIDNFKTKLKEYQTKNITARTLLNWTPIPEDFRSINCQNTKRSGGVNKRVIGYIDYELYYGYTPVIGYETSIRNRSLSLKGRLFGSWYDSWATGQEHYYFSTGLSQTGYILFDNTINYSNGYTVNWDFIHSSTYNGLSEVITWSPTHKAFLPVLLTQTPQGFVTIGQDNKPAFSRYEASFKTASGYAGSDPYCSCYFFR
jgi:hypothetical protein